MSVVATKSGGRRQTDMPSGHPLDIKSAFSIVGCEFGPMRVPRVFRFPKYPSLHDTDRQGKGPAMNMMHRHGIIAAVVAASLGMTLAACSTSGAGTLSSEVTGDVTVSDASATSTTSTISGDGAIDTSDLFTDRDLEQTADLEGATYYTVTSGEDIQISETGVYVISGTASDVTITINAADDAKVQIVLDGVSITNADAPAIYVVSADKTFVTTMSGSTNTLEVTGTFAAVGDTNTDAVIFSKDDLVLNGEGTLSITSTANGVSCKDDLTITGGTYSVSSTEDAFEANDSIAIAGGTFSIDTDKDGFHCENDEDDTVGFVYVCGGSFDISASDDGIQATTVAQIDGGSFAITASEGIEGTFVQINGGTIDISASDDGINAAAKSAALDVVIEFNGGDTTIVMGSGDTDAVDANGSIYVNDGTISITGSSAFDYDVTGELNGGTVTVNGSQITEMTTQMMGRGAVGAMTRG